MPNNLGRDKVWNQQVWQDIDKAVLDEVGRIRVVQKVFHPSTSPSPSNVPADILDLESRKRIKIPEGKTKPFMEISAEFSLTSTQVNDEATLKTGKTLARMAAKSLALAEDKLFLQGADVKLDDCIKVLNRDSAGKGLLGEAGEDSGLRNPIDPRKPEEIFAAVTQAISALNGKGQPGPYALLLESSIYADAYAPLPATLTTTADRLKPLLEGGFYGTGSLPPGSGLLFSLGGEPISLYVGKDAITAFTQEEEDGSYMFRVFERVQFVARDSRSFVKLRFKEAQPADQAQPEKVKAVGGGR